MIADFSQPTIAARLSDASVPSGPAALADAHGPPSPFHLHSTFTSNPIHPRYERHEIREKEQIRKARAAQRAVEAGKKPPPKSITDDDRQPTLADELAKVTGEGVDIKRDANVVDPRLPEFLVQWLNVNIMTNPLKTLPGDLIASHGKLVRERGEEEGGGR